MKVEKNPKVYNDLCSIKVSDLNLNNKSKSKINSKSSLNNAESSSLPKETLKFYSKVEYCNKKSKYNIEDTVKSCLVDDSKCTK